MKDFVKDWNGGHYDKMYQSLTQDEKKKQSKKDFVKRYETIYEQAGVKNLKVTAEKQDEDDKKKMTSSTSIIKSAWIQKQGRSLLKTRPS